MQTLIDQQTKTSPSTLPDIAAIKTKQKAVWESGDFGQIARVIENVAGDFMSRLPLRHGLQVLDVACGTGNLAVIAAQHGCLVSGADIAANLITQARARAAAVGLDIRFEQADAEALPYADDSFDLTVSMYGVMFTPQPDVAAAELRRVTKPGGRIALANWTPEGFIGQMFKIFKAAVPPPAGIPSPLEWGSEPIVQQRLERSFTDLHLRRHIAAMQFPFPPAETVEFFRKHYGPTNRVFESLPAERQAALRHELVELQTNYNTAKVPGTTEALAEYLEVVATKK